MPEDGLLRHLIAENYTVESIAKIKEVLASYGTHRMVPVANGLFAASGSQAPDALSGYQNVWVRDNVMVANSFRLRGDVQTAVACIQGLTLFFATQLPRFRDISDDLDGIVRQEPNRRPHIRFIAQNLGELPEKWTHAQNDALGEALWIRFVLAKNGAMPLAEIDAEVYGVFPAYFEAIRYWEDNDSGAWEEGQKVNNSSVGAVVAGLEELQSYQECVQARSSNVKLQLWRVSGAKLRELIAKGRKRLEETLPFESPPERLVDSALLFLIHPLGVVHPREMQDAILNLVQARLRGETGIKRYAGDSYFCQDYDEWFRAGEMGSNFSERLDFRDAHLQPNCEAQWCIFDPLLSIIYGERYLANRWDEASRRKQIYYFNRSLAQLTAMGQCPELYFMKDGRYIPNIHTPLTWTQANQALALHLMTQSLGGTR